MKGSLISNGVQGQIGGMKRRKVVVTQSPWQLVLAQYGESTIVHIALTIQ